MSVIVNAPVRAPAVEGVNVTPIEQVVPPATLVPQLFVVWAKSPLTARLEMLSVKVPVFVRLTHWTGLVVPTG